MCVPTGRGKLNMAARMMPNGDAPACSRARSAADGGRAVNSATSW
jgi:hypothetical protein